jgi:hypothetical protein
MRIQDFRPTQRGDVDEVPDWYYLAERGQNDQVQSLTNLAQGNITFEDNFSGELRTVVVNPDEETDIKLQTTTSAIRGVVFLGAETYYGDSRDFARVAWRRVSQSIVRVRVKYDDTPSGAQSVTLLFLTG